MLVSRVVEFAGGKENNKNGFDALLTQGYKPPRMGQPPVCLAIVVFPKVSRGPPGYINPMKQRKPTIFFGTDHAGYKLKEALKGFLSKKGYSIKDFGTFSEEIVDYPDFISPVAKAVAKNPAGSRGIILGGSGQGEAITANRTKGVRAAVFYGGPEKIIILSREHNDANILSLGARFVSEKQAEKAVSLWLETQFPGEERHKRRIKKIDGS